jgi:hypothetical protein
MAASIHIPILLIPCANFEWINKSDSKKWNKDKIKMINTFKKHYGKCYSNSYESNMSVCADCCRIYNNNHTELMNFYDRKFIYRELPHTDKRIKTIINCYLRVVSLETEQDIIKIFRVRGHEIYDDCIFVVF